MEEIGLEGQEGEWGAEELKMPGKKGTQKNRTSYLERISSSAINQGFQELMESHPIFKDYQKVIQNHVDQKKIKTKLGELISNKKIDPRNISKEEAKYLSEELSNYVSSGNVLDEKGQEIILGKGLEEKVSTGFIGKVRSFFRREDDSEGVEYLEKAISAAEDLKQIFGNDKYGKRMPEISKAVSTLENIGSLYSAARVLKANNWINESQYQNMVGKVYDIARESPKKIKEAVETRITDSYKKIAASIFGIIGLFMVVSNLTMTGGAIGVSSGSASFAGISLIFLAFVLFFIKGKKKTRRKNKKKL